MKNKPALVVSLLSLLLLPACHSIRYSFDPETGESRFSRQVLGTQIEFGDLEVTIATNGSRTVKLKGYTSDQVQAIGAVAEGVAKGMTSAISP